MALGLTAEDTRRYWNDLLPLKDQPHIAIVENRFYVIGNPTDHIKGFYGRKFKILFHDGRLVESDNLWNGSLIPEEFREKLPNNAEFLPVE